MKKQTKTFLNEMILITVIVVIAMVLPAIFMGYSHIFHTANESFADVPKEEEKELIVYPLEEEACDLEFPNDQFDYVQEIVVHPEYLMNGIEEDKHYSRNEKKKLALQIDTSFTDHVVCFPVSISHLYQNASFVFKPETIVLFDSDKTSYLPYWIQDDYTQEILLWVRLPEYHSQEQKKLYIAVNQKADYSFVPESYRFSDKNSVFIQKDTSLIGWYSFLQSNETSRFVIPDLSGNGHDGKLSNTAPSGFLYPASYMDTSDLEYQQVYFAQWVTKEQPNYFILTLGAETLDFSKKGSLELWVNHEDGPINGPTWKDERNKQLLLVTDPTGQFTLQYIKDQFLFSPAGEETTMVFPYEPEEDEVFQVVVNWDFWTKTCQCFVNGERLKSNSTGFKNWNNVTSLSELHFFGTNPPAENDFGGTCRGLYVYNQCLSPEKVKLEYSEHNPTCLYEQAVFASYCGSYWQLLLETMDVPEGDSLYYSTYYASPEHIFLSRTPEREEELTTESPSNKKRRIYRIFDGLKEYQPILGMESHFYQYQGTLLEATKPCFVQYIRLKINNPDLIKDLRVSFSYQKVLYNKKDSSSTVATIWRKLVQPVHACGPYYSFKNYGETSLELLMQQGDSYLYKLKTPIYINEEADFMQLEYLPNNAKGYLSVVLEDVYLLDESGTLTKGQYKEFEEIGSMLQGWDCKWNEKTNQYDYFYWDKPMTMYSNYEAFLAGEEKGLVTIETTNGDKTLSLRFSNTGEDVITISDESIAFIIQKAYISDWSTIEIVPASEEEFFPQYPIQKKVLPMLTSLKGKQIEPGKYIDVPIISIEDFSEYKNFVDVQFIGLAFGRKEDNVSAKESIDAYKTKDLAIVIWEGKTHSYDRYSKLMEGYVRIGITQEGTFKLPLEMPVPYIELK